MRAPQIGKRPCAAPRCEAHVSLAVPLCAVCLDRLPGALRDAIDRLAAGAMQPDASRRGDCALALQRAVDVAREILAGERTAPPRHGSLSGTRPHLVVVDEVRRVRLASPDGHVNVQGRCYRNGRRGSAIPDPGTGGWLVRFDDAPGPPACLRADWLVFEPPGDVRPTYPGWP